MSVSNGQLANQTTFNNAFISRTQDSSTIGQVDLLNTDPESGATISNVQRELNKLNSFLGSTPETAEDTKPTWTNTDVGTSTDDVKTRADDLTAKFNATLGHVHSGLAGDAPPVDASDLASVKLRGYFMRGTDLIGVTGTSSDVSTPLTGKTESTGPTVKGVVTTVGYNRAILKDAASATQDDLLKDANGDVIYGEITKSGAVWTLSFYKNVSGVKTAHNFTSSQDIIWYYQELFNPIVDAPVYSEIAFMPSDNATQDVIDATASLRGLVNTGAQSFGGVKTFVDTTQSTTKDNGGVVLEGGLGVEKNINAGGTVLGSNLSGTNTGDVTLGAIGATPSANGASLSGQILTLQPADATYGGVVTAIAQTFAGAKTFAAKVIHQLQAAFEREDVATTASITALSSAKSFVKMTGSTATTIHGIAAGSDGQVLTVYNGSSAVVTFKHESGTASAADRLVLPGGQDITIAVNSTSAFIYDTGQSRWVVYGGSGGSTSPLTTKGDLYTRDASADARLPVGANNYVLVADSSQTTGLKWAAPSGGGGGSLQWVEDTDAPTTVVENNQRLYVFADGLTQYLYALVKVPASYVAGQQIKMRVSPYASTSTNTILMQSVATLVRAGTDAISSTTNQRTSTNAAVANIVDTPQTVVLDLTDASGQINSVAVSANDLIKVRLQRGTGTNTNDVKVPVYGAEVTFNG